MRRCFDVDKTLADKTILDKALRVSAARAKIGSVEGRSAFDDSIVEFPAKPTATSRRLPPFADCHFTPTATSHPAHSRYSPLPREWANEIRTRDDEIWRLRTQLNDALSCPEKYLAAQGFYIERGLLDVDVFEKWVAAERYVQRLQAQLASEKQTARTAEQTQLRAEKKAALAEAKLAAIELRQAELEESIAELTGKEEQRKQAHRESQRRWKQSGMPPVTSDDPPPAKVPFSESAFAERERARRLRAELDKEKELTSALRGRLVRSETSLEALTAQLETLAGEVVQAEKKFAIKFKDGGQFSSVVRQAYYELLDSNVPANKSTQVLVDVLSLFGHFDADSLRKQLPSDRTVRRMVLEMGEMANIQIGDALCKLPWVVLHHDGTTLNRTQLEVGSLVCLIACMYA